MAADFSNGWHVMAKAVRDLDELKVKDIKEDIDTLLVFVSRYRHDRQAKLTLLFRLVFSLLF